MPTSTSYSLVCKPFLSFTACQLAPPDPLQCTHSATAAALQVAYSVEADEDGAVRLACRAVDGGGLYPEEVCSMGR